MTTSAAHVACAFRRARPGDAPALIATCRSAFPRSFRWDIPSAASSWWIAALRSAAAEVWVDTVDTRVRGFALIVIDEARWAEETERRGSRRRMLMHALQRPSHPAAWVIRSISAGRASLAALDELPSVEATPAHRRIWLELIALSSRDCGQGIGHNLLSFLEQRARELSRRAIQLSVERRNTRAVRLYARAGYGIVHQRSDKLVLGKRL